MNATYSRLIEQMLQAFQSQQLETANKYATMILKLNSKDLVALQVQGLCLAMQGRVVESVAPLYRASKLDPNNLELLSNLAKAQYGADMYSEAIQTYKTLDRLMPNNPELLTDMGTSLAKLRFYDEARACFERSIEIQPDYFLTWSNYGNLLSELGSSVDAINAYEKSLAFKSDYPDTWTNYGNALFDLGRFKESRLAHEQALNLNPEFAEAWSNYGNTLLELKDPGDYEAYQKAYALKPDHSFLLGQLFGAATTRCDWTTSDVLESEIISKLASYKKVVHPFILLQTSAPIELQKLASSIYIQDKVGENEAPPSARLQKYIQRDKVRIGYFSSDFKEHPVGVLFDNILQFHDKNRFEIYGFFLNSPTGDAVEKSIANKFTKVFNLHGVGDSDAINLIRDQNLDLAIDLNGHTSGARPILFAEKISPIQVNYLGYAGTSGADFYSALIADEVVIPPEQKIHYSEPVFYLPHSFFPVDTSISIESMGDMPTKGSEGLPEAGFVFTCFNNAYKIKPAIFDIWMTLLKNVPGSVLWLSKPNSTAIANLQIEAQKRGIDASRLIFADRKEGRSEHLSRLRLADLFLDTPNYNAHATAADALWAGVPVLTLIGNTFAGRVAASQLNVLGLTELITHSDSEYLAKALDLATHPGALRSIRSRLAESRGYSPLFNTRQYVADLESLLVDLLNKVNQH
ncbi:MAG: hypothetical protein B7Y55_03770 [Polynucleobacter sp. 35-46-207]|nr:MAG: hypothetical protein B7Y55_03770 [Polynucleobacter sp. 35-46-207]OZB47682.1 MAG: hypothetical protein B7X60_05635 [Polynucleobacter sp. 39-45-136]